MFIIGFGQLHYDQVYALYVKATIKHFIKAVVVK